MDATRYLRWTSGCLVAAAAAVSLLLPVASADNRPTSESLPAGRPGTAQHVTWSGYHGVKFGEPLKAAARRLHGKAKSDEPRSDAKFVDYPGGLVAIFGSLRWEGSGAFRAQVRSGRKVGSFLTLSRHVIFPHHAFVGESLARFRRSLGKRGRRERPEHNAAVGYYLVGPRGRTLWAYGSRSTRRVEAIGLTESLAGARVDWSAEG